MKPIKQKYLHIPNVQNGDCWRACIASIIECDIDELPVPVIEKSWSEYSFEMDQKLTSMGWENRQYSVKIIREILLTSPDTDGHILALGLSPRFTNGNERINHCIVWKDGMVHDPHPENKGLMDIIAFEVMSKISKQDSDVRNEPKEDIK